MKNKESIERIFFEMMLGVLGGCVFPGVWVGCVRRHLRKVRLRSCCSDANRF